jgi:predicted kinase
MPKIVFLAGSPGSGKNYVADQLFGTSGFVTMSLDELFEKSLAAHGYGTDLTKIPKHTIDALREEARVVLKQNFAKAIAAKKDIVWDGMGQVPSTYQTKKVQAEQAGYESFCTFVETSVDTSLKRNAARTRKLPDDLVKSLHAQVQAAKPQLKKMFGQNMFEINNENGVDNTETFNKIRSRITGSTPTQQSEPSSKLKDMVPASVKQQMTNQGGHGSGVNYDEVTLYNPETQRNIKLSSALSYPPDHPMHQLAQKYLNQHK